MIKVKRPAEKSKRNDFVLFKTQIFHFTDKQELILLSVTLSLGIVRCYSVASFGVNNKITSN